MEKKEKEIMGHLTSECTTIVVGCKATGDGSHIYARSEDFDAMRCKNWLVFPDTDNGPEEFGTAPTTSCCLISTLHARAWSVSVL